MRPRLKNSTLYVPSADGVYIISNSGTLTLKGKQIYQWLDSIAPYLDGTHTLLEITNSLSENRRELVANLVRALHDKGFIKDVTGELPHTLAAEDTAAYASEIAFIDYYVDSPAHRFERFRNSKILALGSGLTLTALVQANLNSGLAQVLVAPTAEAAADHTRQARHAELARRAHKRDPRQTLTEASAWVDAPAAIAAAIAPLDAIAHVSDRPMLGRARRLNHACVAHGKRLIQAVVQGDQAWIGPLVGAEAGAACWECAWLRVLGHRDAAGADEAFADQPHAVVSDMLAGPTAAIVSNQLSFELFKHLTGGGPLETGGAIIALDLETLESKAHPVIRHPLCAAHGEVGAPGEAEVLEAVQRRAQGPELEIEAFSRQAARLFDDRTGILASLGEDDFEQLPLKVSRATVSNPMASQRLGWPIHATAVATEFAEARQRATRRACELYAASVVDRRRVAVRGAAAADDRLWGYDLAARAPRMIRAGLAYPVLDGVPASEATAPGLASGARWSEAVARGLLGQCTRLTVAELARSTTACPRIDLDTIPRTGTTARYGRLLDVVGEALTVYDVTGSLGVPTLAGCLGEHTVAYAASLDLPQALEAVFERALQAYQARANRQPAYAPPEVPALPHARRGTAVAPRRSAAAPSWPEMQDALVGQLVRAGWRPVVALLDHDPVIETVLPYVANVVVTPAEDDA